MNYPDSSYNSASSDLYNSMGSLNNNGSYQVLPMPFFSGQNLEGIRESIEDALAAEEDSPLNEDDEREIDLLVDHGYSRSQARQMHFEKISNGSENL